MLLSALAALAFVLWLSAPAFSVRPYVPDPIDFEMRDRAPELKRTVHAASASSRARRMTVVHSRVLEAPKRFNLVGLHWRGAREGTVLIRVRSRGRAWKRWTRVLAGSDDAPDSGSPERSPAWTSSDPLWVGGADVVQYRIAAPGPVRDVRLHFVNSTGTASGFDRLRTGLRRAVSGGVAAVASLLGAGANAQTTQPEIVSREQWGGSKCPPRDDPDYGEVKLAFIHHTVTTNNYGPEDSPSMVLAVCRYHRNSNGWDDIGYQFLVDKYGKIFEGRAGGIDQAVVGAQAQGYNYESTGIANLGTFSTTGQSEEGLNAVARLLSWKLAIHGVAPNDTMFVRSGGGSLNRYRAGAIVRFEAISGHRDGDATSCPGDGLYAQLPRLRAMVSSDTRPVAKLSLKATRTHIPYGRKARLAGLLESPDGAPLANQAVRIQALAGAGVPRTLATLATDSAGSFSKNLRLAFNRVLQAQFAGSAGLQATQSRLLAIRVRTRVTASLQRPSDGAVPAGERVAISGHVRPRKRRALLLVDQVAGQEFRRAAKEEVRVRFGKARATYRPKRPGDYRIRLAIPADGRNLGARSDPITLRVR